MITNFTKTKVSPGIGVVAILLSAAIGTSFVGASLLPATTTTNTQQPATTDVYPAGVLAYDETQVAVGSADTSGGGTTESTCPNGLTGCGPEGGPIEACCASGEECKSALGRYYCKSTTTSCPAPKVLCSGGFPAYVPACCPAGSQCDTAKGIAYCKNAPPNGCPPGSPDPCAKKGVCCSSSQECLERVGVVICQPKSADSCAAGETYCAGSGESAERQKCCASGEECKRHPKSGYPYCYKPPPPIQVSS